LGLPGWSQERFLRRGPQHPPRADHREGRQGDAPAQHARPSDAVEAEGLRRPDPSSPGAEPGSLRDHAGVAVMTAELIQTVGRRKEAIVRVRLIPGTGSYKLNGRTIEDYFP